MSVEPVSKQVFIRPRTRALIDRLREYENCSIADTVGRVVAEACERRGILPASVRDGPFTPVVPNAVHGLPTESATADTR